MLTSLVSIFLVFAVVISSPSVTEQPASQEQATTSETNVENRSKEQSDEVPNELLAPVATGIAKQTITILAVKTLDYSPDGSQIAVGGGEGIARVWEVTSEFLVRQQQAHESWLFDLVHHPNQKILATAGGDNLIKLWNMSEETWTVRELKGHTDDLHGIAFTPDGERLVSGSDDTTVRLWNLETLKHELLGKHDKQVTDIAMSPSDDLAASSSRDGTIRLWDLKSGQSAGILKGHSADVLAIAFSPDGKSLASASYDQTITIWDCGSLKAIRTIPAHEDWVFCVAFSPDGRQLASGGADGKLKLWNLEDGTLLQEVEQPSDISAVVFAPDGKALVAGRVDGYLKLYRVGEQLELFKTIPPASYSPVYPATKTKELTTKDFLQLHLDLLDPDKEQWDQSLGKLSLTGDGFTVKLLDQIDPESLSAPKQEMWTRAREQIRQRTQHQSETQKLHRIDTLLTRAATADLNCHPLELLLKSWTLKEIQTQTESSYARKELRRIRDTVPEVKTELEYGDLHERKKHYIQTLLEGYPDDDAPSDNDRPEINLEDI